MWAHKGIMGIFGYVGKLNFLTRSLLGFRFRAKTHSHTHTHTCTNAYCKHAHTSHPHSRSLLLTYSYTHREAAYALSFSRCLEGEGNCCGSRATERQPSVWLIGISGQRSVESTESEAELFTTSEHNMQQFSTFLSSASVFSLELLLARPLLAY